MFSWNFRYLLTLNECTLIINYKNNSFYKSHFEKNMVLFYIICGFFLKILQTSEKQLARKLAEKGDRITREDIIYLLGDHLRTIEQLQVKLKINYRSYYSINGNLWT